MQPLLLRSSTNALWSPSIPPAFEIPVMDDTASQEHRIRFYRVFVAEQSIPPEEELDEDDATAIHAIALVHGQVVGTGRLVSRDDGDGQVSRMAVDQPWRKRGVGGRILVFLEEEARSLGMERCVLHAQVYIKALRSCCALTPGVVSGPPQGTWRDRPYPPYAHAGPSP